MPKELNSAIANAFATLASAGVDVNNRVTGSKFDVIPTGFPIIDDWLLNGAGGVPVGVIIQIKGNEGTYKTGFSLHMVAQAQKANPDKIALYIDAEGTYTEERAVVAGVDVSRMMVIQGNTAEKQIETAKKALATGVICAFVLDSIGILIEADAKTDNLYKKDKGEGVYKSNRMPARVAKLLTEFVQTITDDLRDNKILTLFINQYRDKIGVTFGPTKDTPDGRLLKFAKVLDLDLRIIKYLSSAGPDAPRDGIQVSFKVEKYKYGPGGIATDDKNSPCFYFTEAAREQGEVTALIDRAVRADVFEITGAWYTLLNASNEQLGKWQGKPKLMMALLQDDVLRIKLLKMVSTKEKLNGSGTRTTSEPIANTEGVEVSDGQED